jgi:hypothetical protein
MKIKKLFFYGISIGTISYVLYKTSIELKKNKTKNFPKEEKKKLIILGTG